MPTATLTGTPAVINAGRQVTLSWTTLRAVNVQIDHGVGPVMPAAAGSITVTPTQTTTNTLRAANAKGATATATFTVTMNPPTVSMTANPTIIAVGNSSTLSVTANDATQVVITDNTDSNPYWLPRNGGTQTVTPTAPTTYTATAATAGNQTATATSIVTVTPGSIKSINHVVFMMQENRTFRYLLRDAESYRQANSFNVGVAL